MSNLVNSFWTSAPVGANWNNISTASYASKSYTSTQNTNLRGSHIRADGTKLYTIGLATDTVYQHTLSTAWDISTASYDTKSFSVATQTTIPSTVWFNTDGDKMYTNKVSTANSIWEYDLGTAWDISTAVYNSNKWDQTLATFNDFWMSNDGLRIILLQGTQKIFYRDLSVAWDITTVDNELTPPNYDFSAISTNITNVWFNQNGKQFLLADQANLLLRQFSCSTAWDLTTASDDSNSFDYSPQDTFATWTSVFMNPDMDKFYVSDSGSDNIYQYSF